MVEYPKDVDFVVLPYSGIYTPFTFEEWQRERDERSRRVRYENARDNAEKPGSSFIAPGPAESEMDALREHLENLWKWKERFAHASGLCKSGFPIQLLIGAGVFDPIERWSDGIGGDSAFDEPKEIRELLQRFPEFEVSVSAFEKFVEDGRNGYCDDVAELFSSAAKKSDGAEKSALQRALALWHLAWELFGVGCSRSRFVIRYENLRRELAVGSLMRFTVEKIGLDQKAVAEMLRCVTSDKDRCMDSGEWDSSQAAKNAQFMEFVGRKDRPTKWDSAAVRRIFRMIIDQGTAYGLRVPEGFGYNKTSDLVSTGGLFKKLRRNVYELKN